MPCKILKITQELSPFRDLPDSVPGACGIGVSVSGNAGDSGNTGKNVSASGSVSGITNGSGGVSEIVSENVRKTASRHPRGISVSAGGSVNDSGRNFESLWWFRR
jgi:hypothetical protein